MICVIESDHCFARKSMTSCIKEVKEKLGSAPALCIDGVYGNGSNRPGVYSHVEKGKNHTISI